MTTLNSLEEFNDLIGTMHTTDSKVLVPNVGEVVLIDHMGDDAAIVQAARVSYGKGTKSVSEDRGLIRYLMRHHHTTPFEQVEFKFRVRVPMDLWRQWIRHRTANVNEYSTRYSEAPTDYATTAPNAWRVQATNNKQGSGGFIPEHDFEIDFDGEMLTAREAQLHELVRHIYQERLTAGVAREQARKDLPLSTYTEAYWKIDLHNLFHFLWLRMDSHAQYEIRIMAHAMALLIIPYVPLAWEAFNDYKRNAATFSAQELAVIREFLRLDVNAPSLAALGKRERDEFLQKVM